MDIQGFIKRAITDIAHKCNTKEDKIISEFNNYLKSLNNE